MSIKPPSLGPLPIGRWSSLETCGKELVYIVQTSNSTLGYTQCHLTLNKLILNTQSHTVMRGQGYR